MEENVVCLKAMLILLLCHLQVHPLCSNTPWIIHTIIIHQQGLSQGTEIDEMMPVTVVPRQA